MTVKQDLDRAYKKKVVELTEKVVRKTAFDIDNEIVAQTPVDTGRARANWLPSLSTPRTDTVEAGQKPDITPITNAYRLNDTIFITNNLPYIERLNNGWSGQQPTPSWVEGTVKKYKARMKQAIAEVSRGL
jgi:hypothetical protein